MANRYRNGDRRKAKNLKYEKSCGAVIYKDENGERKFLLIKQKKGFWSFPKGHVEGEESEHETAAREIREETGLNVAFQQGFRESESYCPRPGVWKQVVFMLARYLDGELRIQEEELMDAGWFTEEEALRMITFENSREIFRKALSRLGA
ncbi:MAG: NUDIX domain-containing protein [Lachnospiraceae bacterium]|nr:NUDIX domain-containing protein [Lachnospiraceae bacterium]